MNRDDLIAVFLARHGYAASDAVPLAQDASFRRYLRIGGDRPAVLMDAPPPEDVGPFLRIAAHLRAAGIAVPAIIAADESRGLVLEEDLGDDLVSALLDRGDAPDPLLDAAVDALVIMQRAAPPSGLPAWDAPAMAATALGTLFDWWWPARFGTAAPEAARDDVAAALAAMLEPVAKGPRASCIGTTLPATCCACPTAASGSSTSRAPRSVIRPMISCPLLQDARRDIPPASRHRALERYLAARPELDPAEFRAAFTACAAQRHLRVACQWVRLALRDGRPQYLVHGPRTWRLLEDALSQPAAEPLAAALDRWIPAAQRGNPPRTRTA